MAAQPKQEKKKNREKKTQFKSSVISLGAVYGFLSF